MTQCNIYRVHFGDSFSMIICIGYPDLLAVTGRILSFEKKDPE